ncbi:unnamed protein product [Polarella glacialis]|uniref:Uncharacterized protein n=1 Tax=Polarella glacialis TaxID=89957 RepID=A0A813INQ9_POLGL|nr:unnamed protein product [Polarella glacialis]
MGCSASVSRRKERSMSHFAQVVPADDVRREAFPPPHAIGRKTNSLFHKAAAKGGEQPVPAAWQDGAAQAKDGSLKVNGHSLDANVDARYPDDFGRLWMRTSMPGAVEISPELKSFNRATVVPEPSGLRSFRSFTLCPGEAEQEAGHPLAPCAPTHKRWLTRLDQALAHWEESPSYMLGSILLRREALDENMAAEDALCVAKTRSSQPNSSWQ